MQKSYYAIIPANVRYNENLTANAKLLYGEITALCNERGFCWASNNYFSELYNVSKTSVSKWISQLKSEGYINIDIKYKEGSKEILHRYISLIAYPIEEKLNTPIEEKLKDNTTVINNTTNSKNNSSNYSKEVFVEDWNELRKKHLGKPSFLANINSYDYAEFKELSKSYSRQQFKEALTGLFKQQKLPNGNTTMQSNPKHFLTHFNSYLSAYHDKNTKLYGEVEAN